MYLKLSVAALLIFNFADAQKKDKSATMLRQADSLFQKANYSQAIPLYESALKKAENAAPQSWYRLGLSYHNAKDYAHAIPAYLKAEKLNSKLPNLRLNMAMAYSAAGDVENARQKLDSAITNGFGNAKLLEQDPELENLRKTSFYKPLETRAFNNSHPCAALPAAHAFDFWLGDWDVYLTSNKAIKTGFNRITSQSDGCVILENWEAQGPHTGVSISYFDPTNNKWKQKWAGSAQDITEFYDGEFSDGVIVFKFDGKNPDGSSFPGRLTFTRLQAGDVRQHSERSNDGGKTWADIYDFTYVRRK